MVTVSRYGTWRSPLTADRLLEDVVSLGSPRMVGETAYWTEGRPSEGGRVAIVRRLPGEPPTDVFGPEFYARTLAHEYGGICYAVSGDTVYFSNLADQRLYRVDPGGVPEPITREPAGVPMSVRYAAPVVNPAGRLLYCVRETHGTPGVATEVVNDIVVLPVDGEGEPRVVASGHDFFSFPTLSPEGDRIAWTCWDHPRMPWDGTELWEAQLGSDGLPVNPRRVAGGENESVTQPSYSPSGRLHFVSDRSGWWNIYADDEGDGTAIAPEQAEYAGPDWVFGRSSYCFVPDGCIVASRSSSGLSGLVVIAPTGEITSLETGYSGFDGVRPAGECVVALAAGPRAADRVVVVSIPGGEVTVLRESRPSDGYAEYLSEPEAIEFPTEGGLTAHALFYPPYNPDYEGPEGELPPLIVATHGGPTAAVSPSLDYSKQYWTSRGFGIVDVNYGGSTGYGREYRERLKGRWGIVDLDDCVNAALYLVRAGRADGDRLLIHGGSAGGYTTLCALTFRHTFASGASYFGVADLGALARHTHKFESRYLDSIVGPWPEAEAIYEERSPIFHTELLSTPIILFQGLEDKVVPPAQAEVMAAALREKGVPFAYVAYEGEQHGFRRSENIKATVEAELYFYSRVLGFEADGELAGVEIENDGALRGQEGDLTGA